jgi:hypothetical protein
MHSLGYDSAKVDVGIRYSQVTALFVTDRTRMCSRAFWSYREQASSIEQSSTTSCCYLQYIVSTKYSVEL